MAPGAASPDRPYKLVSQVGEYESSEPTSLATTSTMEGEHTLSPGAGDEAGEAMGEVRVLCTVPCNCTCTSSCASTLHAKSLGG